MTAQQYKIRRDAHTMLKASELRELVPVHNIGRPPGGVTCSGPSGVVIYRNVRSLAVALEVSEPTIYAALHTGEKIKGFSLSWSGAKPKKRASCLEVRK